MEKMMSFEEWWNEAYGNREIPVPNVAIVKTWASQAFGDARIGTIPAENAVVIPPVGEWPEGANGISVLFVSKDHVKPGCAVWESLPGEDKEAVIQFIPRPKPVWVPQVHDRVFLDNGSASATVCLVTKAGGPMFGIVGPAIDRLAGIKWLKPFHESHIGKPWGEIPGGVE